MPITKAVKVTQPAGEAPGLAWACAGRAIAPSVIDRKPGRRGTRPTATNVQFAAVPQPAKHHREKRLAVRRACPPPRRERNVHEVAQKA